MAKTPGTQQTRSTPAPPRRNTRQRGEILRVLQDCDGPLAVQEILERAQASVPNLGIATVYRTLQLLQEHEQVESLVLPTGETRYELMGKEHHHHFHCRTCDTVFDIDVCPVTVAQGTNLPGNFVVEAHDLTMYGRCPRCA